MASFFDQSLAEFTRLVQAPLLVPEMWWIISPFIIVTLLMTAYFGKYWREKIGWSSAVGNSIVLLFVGTDLLRSVYNRPIAGLDQFAANPAVTIIIIFIMLEGILLSYAAFTRGMHERIMFVIASPVSVNVQAYVMTAIVYTHAAPNVFTLVAALGLFGVIFGLLRLVQEVQHLMLGYHSRKKN